MARKTARTDSGRLLTRCHCNRTCLFQENERAAAFGAPGSVPLFTCALALQPETA